MSLLSEPLALHEIDDVEKFVRATLHDRLGDFSARLRPDLFDEALTELIGVAWELSVRYDPARSEQSFATYAGRIIRFRVADWFRGHFGDSRYGPSAAGDESLDLVLEDRLGGSLDELEDVIGAINDLELTPESRRTLRQIATPMYEQGATMDDLALQYGWARREIARKLERLKTELTAMHLNRERPPVVLVVLDEVGNEIDVAFVLGELDVEAA